MTRSHPLRGARPPAGRGWPRRALAATLAALLVLNGSVPAAMAQNASALPALGDSASEEMPVVAERQLGDRIMREARRDPDLLDDPLLLEYVQSLWDPLVAAAQARGDISDETRSRFAWEAFLVRDRSVNAFALPGGYMGVHLGLIAITQSRDELASVLAHELSHITQRHIARSMSTSRRSSMLGMASILLGLMAAARSPDAANALITGGQAVAVQGQLNFSRDMEREADRVGSGVMAQAGYAPAAMADMFERLQQASRLNDFNQFPYLRTHPLNTERIGEARQRTGLAGTGPRAQADVDVRLVHAAMQGRSRALMDSRAENQARLVQGVGGSANGDLQPVDAMAMAYGGAVAAMRQGQWASMDEGIARTLALAGDRPRALRAVRVLQAEGQIARGQAAPANANAPLNDGSRVGLLLAARAALVPSAPAGLGRKSQEALQTWVALHPTDAAAWTLLGRLYERADQTLPAVRAQAEAQLALGDINGAADRLRAGQRLARRTPGQAESIEASIIDARLKDVELQRRRVAAEERREMEP